MAAGVAVSSGVMPRSGEGSDEEARDPASESVLEELDGESDRNAMVVSV
jgi:hypothetical protein